MKYIAVKLTTTGDDPTKDQILRAEFLIDDLNIKSNVDNAPRLDLMIYHDRLEGDPERLNQLSDLVDTIYTQSHESVGAELTNMTQISGGVFLNDAGEIQHTNNPILHFLLQNIGTYDHKLLLVTERPELVLRFLPKSVSSLFEIQGVDIGSMYVNVGDIDVPTLEDCLSDAEIDGYGDVRDIALLLRSKLWEI